ncbi:unnamed protein product [Gemmataceae bacterium]|nr:unnamed protein product [Gemmataceae bacterium]VTU02465.1 unnamed protein product [Gemmataceae bacterium]
MIRMLVAPMMSVAVAAGLVSFAGPAVAQPPGKGKGFDKKDWFEKKDGFEKGGFGKKDGFEKKGPERGSGDPLRALEADLAKLKSLEADLEAKLKQLKSPARAPEPKAKDGPRGPGGFGPGGFGPPGGFGRGGFGPGGFGPPGMSRGEPSRGTPGSGRGAASGAVQGVVRAASGLSAAQLKEVIKALEKLESEKLRAERSPSRPERPSFAPPSRPEPKAGPRPEGRPAPRTEGRPGSSNDQILERLDRLARELDEIRRAVRK